MRPAKNFSLFDLSCTNKPSLSDENVFNKIKLQAAATPQTSLGAILGRATTDANFAAYWKKLKHFFKKKKRRRTCERKRMRGAV
jgi:hypothetical protein